MLLTTNDLAKAIDNQAQVDMAILDFSKTFDKVSHTRLKHKLEYQEYEAIYLDGSDHFLEITHNKQWWVVSILVVHLCHQGFPTAQFLALCCFLYINDISSPASTVNYICLQMTV